MSVARDPKAAGRVSLVWNGSIVAARDDQRTQASREVGGRARDSRGSLLTRARDASVIYVLPLAALDETFGYLGECGARMLAG